MFHEIVYPPLLSENAYSSVAGIKARRISSLVYLLSLAIDLFAFGSRLYSISIFFSASVSLLQSSGACFCIAYKDASRALSSLFISFTIIFI